MITINYIERMTLMIGGQPKTFEVEHKERTMCDITEYSNKVDEMNRLYDAMMMQGMDEEHIDIDSEGDIMSGQTTTLCITDENGFSNYREVSFYQD